MPMHVDTAARTITLMISAALRQYVSGRKSPSETTLALDLMTSVVLTSPILVSRKPSSSNHPQAGMIRAEGETQLNVLETHLDAGLWTRLGPQAVNAIAMTGDSQDP
eukprot:3751859-Rhodomonas_salina.4